MLFRRCVKLKGAKMRRILLFCSLFLFLISNYALTPLAQAEEVEKHVIEYVTQDKYVLRANLSYPQVKKQKYPIAILLHSFGLSSEDWRTLPAELHQQGFAVLEIDFRGHGKSIYLTNMQQRSHIHLGNDSLKQFPNDVYQILRQAFLTYDNISGSEILLVGADIGASAAIFVADALEQKPTAMVLISPQIEFKGLYTPVALAEAGDIPILGVITRKDLAAYKEIEVLQKYAQGSFSLLRLPEGGPGMTCLAVNDGAVSTLVTWLVQKTPSLNFAGALD